MATKKQINDSCQKHGILIQELNNKHYSVDCPKGFVFFGTDLHYLEQWNNHGEFTAKEFYGWLYEYIEEGIMPCHIENCEYCSDNK